MTGYMWTSHEKTIEKLSREKEDVEEWETMEARKEM